MAANDDALLSAYVDGTLSDGRLRAAVAAQTVASLVHPVFFGSALTGAGVDSIMAGIAELLPATFGDADGPVSGTVFKVERGPAGEKIAYVRMFSGTVRIRDRHGEDKVTAISVFDEGGAAMRSESIAAGQIGKVWGLAAVRIGDAIGARRGNADHHFAPPTLETVVAPCRDEDSGRLRVALAQLAEQDPLIDVRQDDSVRELSVSLYGEVQKEVIGATLASDYGLGVTFREATPSTSSALSRRARRSRSSTRTRIRSMPRSGYASIRRPQARGTTSCSTSIPGPCRCTSTRHSRASRTTWPSTSAARCARASPDGASRTAS